MNAALVSLLNLNPKISRSDTPSASFAVNPAVLAEVAAPLNALQLRSHARTPSVAIISNSRITQEAAVAYFLVVKSVSSSELPSSAPAQVQESNGNCQHRRYGENSTRDILLDLLPQAHLSPVTVFSSPERLQVQAPAARWPVDV